MERRCRRRWPEFPSPSTASRRRCFSSRPGRSNLQTPFSLDGGRAVIAVNNNGAPSNEIAVPVSATSPGVFSVNQNGLGHGIITHANYTLVSEDSPAAPGEHIVVFLTGLGAVSPAFPDGAPAPGAEPFARTVDQEVSVEFGGEAGTVSYSGAAPGFVGPLPDQRAGARHGIHRSGDSADHLHRQRIDRLRGYRHRPVTPAIRGIIAAKAHFPAVSARARRATLNDIGARDRFVRPGTLTGAVRGPCASRQAAAASYRQGEPEMRENLMFARRFIRAAAVPAMVLAQGLAALAQSNLVDPRSIAPFVPAPWEAVDRMLEIAAVTEDDLVYDLGSGDGRILVRAAKNFGARAVGFEINPRARQRNRVGDSGRRSGKPRGNLREKYLRRRSQSGHRHHGIFARLVLHATQAEDRARVAGPARAWCRTARAFRGGKRPGRRRFWQAARSRKSTYTSSVGTTSGEWRARPRRGPLAPRSSVKGSQRRQEPAAGLALRTAGRNGLPAPRPGSRACAARRLVRQYVRFF